nr:response regulator transcription factor [Desulfuromonadales bacterium]
MNNQWNPIRVILVDDHQVLREALSEKLGREADIDVIGEAGDAAETMRLVPDFKPDVLVLDVALPGTNGIDIARQVKEISPSTEIVAFSMYNDKHVVGEMLRAGVSGYVTKTASRTDLLNAIRAVAAGDQYLCPEASAALANRFKDVSAALSKREQEVLRLLAAGRRSHEIAEQLHISAGTVEVHRRNIM